MEIETIFGFTWVKASYFEIGVVAAFLLLLGGMIGLLKYYHYLSEKKIQDESLFLFKAKRFGLSNFQIRLLHNLAKAEKLSNPSVLLEQSALFEQAIGRFLLFLRKNGNESPESLEEICKDIVITYEKIYNPALVKKPLDEISQIETGQLCYFTTSGGAVYLGKILTKTPDSLTFKLFRTARRLQELAVRQPITVYLWRVGDAEYVFQSETVSLDKNILVIFLSEQFSRQKEFRLPYVDTIIPMTITTKDPGPLEEARVMKGTLVKINDYEAVVRTGGMLDYQDEYYLDFEAMDFKFRIAARILANKTAEEGSSICYTLKFDEMSEAARGVLKKFIYEQI